MGADREHEGDRARPAESPGSHGSRWVGERDQGSSQEAAGAATPCVTAIAPADPMPEPALLTPDQVAERLGVRRARVLALVRGGAIGVVRLGPRTVRFRPSDVEAYIDRQRRPAIEERRNSQRAAGAYRSPQPASGRAAPMPLRRVP